MLDTLASSQTPQLQQQTIKVFKFIINKLNAYANQNSSSPSHHDSLILPINKLLSDVVRSNPKETDLIVGLVHYGINVYSKTDSEYMLNLLEDVSNQSTSRAEVQLDLRELFKDKFLASVQAWIRKECQESLLVNYGLQKRSSNLTIKFTEQQACLNDIRKLRLYIEQGLDNNDMKMRLMQAIIAYQNRNSDRFGDEHGLLMREERRSNEEILDNAEDAIRRDLVYLGTENEAQIYARLLDVDTSQAKIRHIYKKNRHVLSREMSRGEKRGGKNLSEFSVEEKFTEFMNRELKSRLLVRASIDFRELVILRNKLKTEKYRDFFVSKMDGVINERLADNVKSIRNLEILIKYLKENLPLLKYFTQTLLESQWPKEGPERRPVIAGRELLDWVFTWEPWLFIVAAAVSEGSDTVISSGWMMNYVGAFSFLVQTVRLTGLGEQRLSVVRLLSEREEVVGKFGSC